jgi:hypothetical protein
LRPGGALRVSVLPFERLLRRIVVLVGLLSTEDAATDLPGREIGGSFRWGAFGAAAVDFTLRKSSAESRWL